MLAGFHTATTRAVCKSFARSPYTLRPIGAAVELPRYTAPARACHNTTAKFTNLGPDGSLVTKDVSIRVGDLGEAYVLIPTEIGYALQASSLNDSSSTIPKSLDRLALNYFHDTQHFAADSSRGYPRLGIPQQLPRQSTAATSPATLYLYGVMHTIALDGTPDADFAELAGTIRPEIGEALDKLKYM